MIVLAVLAFASPFLNLIILVAGGFFSEIIANNYYEWRTVAHVIFFVGSVSFTLFLALQNI